MNSSSHERLKWFLLILLGCIWGSSFILIKKGLQHYSSLQAATIRLTTAAVVLLPFAISQFKYIPKNKRKYIGVTGMVAMFIPAYLFCFAQMHISSSLAGIANSLTPTFTFLISMLIFKNRYSPIQLMGLLVGLCGSVYLSFMSTSGKIELNPYVLMVIVATICYGVNINVVKEYLHGVKSWAVSTCSISFAGLSAIVFVLIPNFKSYIVTQESLGSFLALVLLGLLGTALAIILFNELIKIASPLFASSNTYIIPIVAIIWGILFGETISIHHIIGMALLLISILCIRTTKFKIR